MLKAYGLPSRIFQVGLHLLAFPGCLWLAITYMQTLMNGSMAQRGLSHPSSMKVLVSLRQLLPYLTACRRVLSWSETMDQKEMNNWQLLESC